MTKINKIRNKRGKLTTDITEPQRIIRNYYEQLYAKKYENLGEMVKFLDIFSPPKLSSEETENLNRQIAVSEIEAVTEKLLAHKNPGPEINRILQNI